MASEIEPNESDARSAEKFLDALEMRLKRFPPVEYAPFAATRLKESVNEKSINNQKWIHTPHWRILHSIEANCAYARGHARNTPTLEKLYQVMNIYHDLEPTGKLTELINAGKIDLMMMHMWRQQMELQHSTRQYELPMAWHLFSASENVGELSTDFKERYGLTTEQWIRTCFLAYAIADKSIHNTLFVSDLKQPGLGIPVGVVDSFLSEACWTPMELGAHFKMMRGRVSPENHTLIRTSFFEKPLLRFGSNQLLAPDENLLLRFATLGLYSRAKSFTSFGQEKGFPRAFERWVKDRLQFISRNPKIYSADNIKSALPGEKICDFIVESDTEIILVECKGTGFTSRSLEPDVIRNDTSTRKIVDGTIQLFNTAKGLIRGGFDALGVDKSKPIFSMVVTFGEIPSVNSPWYVDEILKPLVATQQAGIDPALIHRISGWPNTLPVQSLEFLAMICCDKGLTLADLWRDRSTQPYHVHGEWDNYIRAKYEGSPARMLPVTKIFSDKFVAHLKASDGHERPM